MKATFSNGAAAQSYPDVANLGVSNPAGTGSVGTNVLGIDLPDAGAVAADSVYHESFTFLHSSTEATPLALTFSGSSIKAGMAWGIDNVEVNLTSAGYAATTTGGVTFLHGPKGDPAAVGCADGTREGFVDATAFPSIAGCEATWSGSPSMRSAVTGAACGDGIGGCAVPADACAAGWHVCGANAVSDLRALSPLDCANAGDGTFVSATSHCASQAQPACSYDTTSTASYSCYASGWCSEPVCCGGGCTRFGNCPSGVWTEWTHITWGTGSCGAMPAPAGGVMCCR
jgi:hypothetical protein